MRRLFRADLLPGGRGKDRSESRRVPQPKWRDPARRGVLWSAQLPAHDGGTRGREPAGGEAAWRVHGGMRPMFDKIAIIGLGLIGSSIAHAARRAGLAKEISGHDASADVLARAAALGFCDTLH